MLMVSYVLFLIFMCLDNDIYIYIYTYKTYYIYTCMHTFIIYPIVDEH